jgi:prepilin-type N-terminal cleavage/methylation domain-containing protein
MSTLIDGGQTSGPSGPAAQSGFSLIELLIAMVVTLIITGAMMSLILSGQSAFKRDPEIGERQQNIRIAMDLIQRDLSVAGMAMGAGGGLQWFAQGLNSQGVPSTINPGESSDHLQFIGESAACPEVPVAVAAPGSLTFPIALPSCYTTGSPALLLVGTGAQCGFMAVARAGNSTTVTALAGQQGPGCTAPLALTAVTAIAPVSLIRYEVAPVAGDVDPNTGQPIPGLWRSATAGVGGGAYNPVPSPAGNWQLVARGIEDMQIRYNIGLAADWQDDPGAQGPGALVTQVRVTLSGRTTSLKATSVAGVTTLRGQLTSETTPRAALLYQTGQPPNWQ